MRQESQLPSMIMSRDAVIAEVDLTIKYGPIFIKLMQLYIPMNRNRTASFQFKSLVIWSSIRHRQSYCLVIPQDGIWLNKKWHAYFSVEQAVMKCVVVESHIIQISICISVINMHNNSVTCDSAAAVLTTFSLLHLRSF